MHCEPNRCAASRRNSGRATAAVFTPTLSAPARSSASTSATVRTPPPTVSGMNTCSAVRRTTSYVVSRPELDAVMSRKVSSSAPSASYTRAISTGSPASRRSVKLTPLTTRPASTSRHGITRTATVTGPAPRTALRARARLPAPREGERAGVERLADDGALDARPAPARPARAGRPAWTRRRRRSPARRWPRTPRRQRSRLGPVIVPSRRMSVTTYRAQPALSSRASTSTGRRRRGSSRGRTACARARPARPRPGRRTRRSPGPPSPGAPARRCRC